MKIRVFKLAGNFSGLNKSDNWRTIKQFRFFVQNRSKLVGFLICFFIFFEFGSVAQTSSKSAYWIQLKDKTGSAYQLDHPEKFLSQRALDRRNRQHIAIDETDLPVSAVYLDSLQNLGFEIVHTSKWLNGITAWTDDSTLIQKVENLPFVVSIQLTKPANKLKSTILKFREDELNVDIDPLNYGMAINQLQQLNGQYLHSQGFRGKGIQIAILDAGFWHVNDIDAFDSLRTSKRILGIHDFVDPMSDFYNQHTHGMSVLSCMGGNIPGSLIGTAPDASFYLFRSEDAATEYLIEEDNWVAAAELADSLGVDIINSSLGYSEFDDPEMNHTYPELNGQTTRVTQGANMAFHKGILVVNSAGNEANNSWKYIIAPSDGENVIGVAAVDKNGIRASFSSVGPAFGGAIKPNVSAMGSSTYLVTSSGVLGTSSGTSFSSPVLAGMTACLLQANPYANVKQLKMAIEQSASQYSSPDSLLGYGIPDFEKADKYLKVNSSVLLNWESSYAVSPNPFQESIFIQSLKPNSAESCTVSIFNLQGICLWNSTEKYSGTILLKNLGNLPDGFLILSIRSGGMDERIKLVKTSR